MTLVHLVGPWAELGSDSWPQPHNGPPVPCCHFCSNAMSPCFPKLEGVAFKGGLICTIKQTWAAGPAPPCEDNSYLYPVSCFQNIKKDWEFRRAVLRQKKICIVGLNLLFPPPWKEKFAVCYFSLDFYIVRSLLRSKAAMENRLGSDFGLMQFVSSPSGCWDNVSFDLDIYCVSLLPPSVHPSLNHHHLFCLGRIFT